MAKRKSLPLWKHAICWALLAACVGGPWACEFDTAPKILPHPPVDEDDSGDDRK